MKIKHFFSILLIIFILPLYIFAGTTGKIVGIVKDKASGDPLIGVNIVLEGTTYGSTTDLDGSYLILNVPPGNYTVTFQYIGYREVKISDVNVKVDATTTVSTELQEATIDLGETIEVIAQREIVQKDMTGSQSEVSANEIKSIPADQFEDVLQLQAGVSRGEDGGFHIRGGRSSEVAYWVDGISVTDVYDGSNAVEIENNAVQSLQVISGTFNAEYGQSMSGIINIVTKDGGNQYSGSISAYTGDYISNADNIFQNIDNVSPSDLYDFNGSLSGPVPFLSKRANFFANVRYNYTDGYLYGRRDVNVDGSQGDRAYVPLNNTTWYSGQGKLSYNLTNLMKLQIGFNYENKDFREYDNYYRFNPDGHYYKFQWGYNGTVTLNHTLNTTTFYTLKFARFEKNFKQYVFENPNDPRYVNNLDSMFATSEYQFSKGGQQNEHFNRTTLTDIVKLDLTSQISKRHLIKTGFEGRVYNLDYFKFNIIDAFPENDTLFQATQPEPDNVNYNKYNVKPVEFSFYVQDKMEYENFILNIGVRFDYFDSKGKLLSDPQDPNIYSPVKKENEELTLEQRRTIWYKDASPRYQVSPRIGMAYPISATGVIHASYGHFLQMPDFQYLYENPDFKLNPGIDNVVGNADLEAQKTVMYEIGLQQEITPVLGIDVTGFYRDVRNWVGTSPLIETYRSNLSYSQYENRDYANVRGVTVSLNKRMDNHIAGNLSYTMQVAEGSASDPKDAFNDIKDNKEPRKSIIPLDWDRRQIINGNVFLSYGTFGVSLLGRYETGLPYSPEFVQGATRGANVQSGFSTLQENSGRRPNLLTFDLQLTKDFYLDMAGRRSKFQLFGKVYNLFDRRNEQKVWGDTGRATYTLKLQGQGGALADPRWVNQPDYYTEPRRVQVGVSFDF